MADILLQLVRKSFEEIGFITNQEDDEFDDEWATTHRPLTINMNELVQLGNIPPHLLPQTTFKTASAYFLALAEMHMIHLTYQRNDAIESAEDCRRKYIARCLFRKLARESRLGSMSHDKGLFELFAVTSDLPVYSQILKKTSKEWEQLTGNSCMLPQSNSCIVQRHG
ncbi:hypothetical protein DPV78_008896 [Talaromyces pinophilus]|nr:hypothetical protein DPV78_008896 [Talaromyces pinophilus]